MHKLIVTNQSELSSLEINGVEIVSPKNYFILEKFAKQRNVRVFNLCKDYGYQSKGYYVSLLAEARGHKPLPDVKNLQDIKSSSIIKSLTDDLDELIQKSFKNIKSKEFILSVYFGQNVALQHEKLSLELHKLFPVPLFRAKFIFSGKWVLQGVKTIAVKDVPEHHFSFLKQAAHEYFDKKRYHKSKESTTAFDLAILVNKEEKSPPSNERALVKFKESAEKQGFFVEFITKDDASRINEFDALFIRATTSVNHFTYKIARKAESEGLVVIDDPSSILKCANKVYLAELLRNAKIETPKTLIIHSDNKNEVAETLGLPCILKLPDSSFSVGVVKVSTLEELNDTLKKMLEQSELLIGQSYMPTDFDWRIGVIDGKAFYACKYFMARGHWQIYNWSSGNKEDIIGDFETLEISNVPVNIISMAEKATALIGSGLYGVDLKDSNGKVVVIEINDNPSIDFGVEDLIDKDLVYDKIIGRIKRKVMSRATNEKYDYV